MDVFTLAARIFLDTSEYDKGISNSESKLSSFGGALKSGFGTIAKVGAAAIGAASAAVGAFATSSVKTGLEFDSSMAQVAATLGLTMDEMTDKIGKVETAFGAFEGNLREFAQFMGENTAFSATQAAEALNYMALAGYDAQQSMDMLPNVLDLAAAGAMDLGYASDMITDSQSALGLSFEQTTELVDKMAKTASRSNTSVAQLGSAILTVGGTAKNLKGGTTELAAALGILADNGMKGAEGGTKLRNMIQSLTSPTDQANELMKSLGVSAFDADGNMKPLNETFAELSNAMSDMTQEGRMQALSEIFNARDIKAAEAMLANYNERWNELSGEIDNAKGAASQMAATQLDNLAGDITLFKSALEGAKIAISDGLTPQIRDFVQFETQGVQKLATAFKEDGISGVMEALGTILSDGLNMIIESLPDWIKAGMDLLEALGKGILDNLDIIIDAAVKIVGEIGEGIIKALPELTKGAIEILLKLGDALVESLPEIMPALTEMLQNMGEMIIENIPEIVKCAAEIILGLADGIAKSLPDLIPTIVDIMLAIVDALIDNVDLLVDAAIEIILALTDGLINALPKLIEKAPEIVEKLMQAIIRNAPKLLQAAGELIMKLVSGIISNVPKVIDAGWRILTSLVSGILNASNKLVQTASSLMTQFKDGIMGFVNNASSWGRDLIDNFVSGIKNAVGKVRDAVTGIADTVKSILGFSEPEEGPLSNFHTYAPDMMKLFAQGIKQNENIVSDQLKKSFDFSNVIAEQTVNVNNQASGTGGNVLHGGLTVNVYGAEGQSADSIADAVMDRILHEMDKAGAVYA